jgi:hypothetical protein
MFAIRLPRTVNILCCMPGIAGRGPGLAYHPGTRPSQEHDMPNRGELAMPAVCAATGAATAADAWTIIGFCAIGWLMSIFAAVSALGFDAVPRLMAQFPGIM